jgi:uncharacterized membrane protein
VRSPWSKANPYSCPVAEDDEQNRQPGASAISQKPEDNSLGRLLSLSDGVFAIAMTLLALDLTVPVLKAPNHSGHVTNQQLIHALAQQTDSYWSFILSFYVIAIYWGAHRRLMRSVTVFTPNLVRDTVFLLLLVAAMPFPTSLLGTYGSLPFALTLYGAFNIVAVLLLMLMSHDVRSLNLIDHHAAGTNYERRWQSWLSLGVFVLCLPAGYVLGNGHGAYVLLLLALPARISFVRKIFVRSKRARTSA